MPKLEREEMVKWSGSRKGKTFNARDLLPGDDGCAIYGRRYFVVEVVPENPAYFRWNALYRAIIESIKRLHGDFGVAATTPGFQVKYCNAETHIAFVSVGRGPHQLVATALPLITKIGGQAASVRTIHVAASMKHGFLFVKKYHEEKLKELEASLNPNEKERWKVEKARALWYR